MITASDQQTFLQHMRRLGVVKNEPEKKSVIESLRAALGAPVTVTLGDRSVVVRQPTLGLIRDHLPALLTLQDNPMQILSVAMPVLAKCCSLSVEDLEDLPLEEALVLAEAFLRVFDVPGFLKSVGAENPKAGATAESN
jgi:hypothetical protein